MAVSDLHHQVASIALAAAARFGFALGGGNALLAHGLTTRPTQDVDLFTDQDHGVEAATAAVEQALAAAGLQAERHDDTADLADLFQAWAKGWPSGSLPLQMASRHCCKWPTSTAAVRR
jgi:Nucleotidyl transferase AbiEii toxin, Type IV TA system